MKVPVADGFEQSQSNGPTTLVRAAPVRDVSMDQVRDLSRSALIAGRLSTTIGSDMQRDINEAKVKERDNAIAEQIRELQTGYLNTLGKDAIEGAAGVREQLGKLAANAGEGLDNDFQKRAASEITQRRVTAAIGQVGQHEAQQSKVYASGQAAARAQSAAEDMAANVGTPDLYNRARNTMLEEVRRVGQLAGKSQEEIAAQEKRALSAAHVSVVQQMMAQDQGTAALAYLKEHGGEIDPEPRSILKNRLDAVATKDQSLKLFLGLGGKSYASQIQSANRMFADGKIDAETHDALMQRIDHAESQKNKRQSDYDRSMLGSAQDWVLQNPQASVQEMPDNLYAWAKQNGQLASLNSLANRPTVSDVSTVYAINEMLDTPEGQARFSREFDLNTVRDKLSDEDFLKLQTLQRKTGEQLKVAMAPRTVAKRVIDQVKGELAAAGLDPTPNPNNRRDSEDWATFSNRLREEVVLRTEIKGTPLTDEEARQVGLDLLKEGRVPGGFIWGSRRRQYEVEPGQRFTPSEGMTVEDVLNNPVELAGVEAAVSKARPDLVPGTPEFQDAVEMTITNRLRGSR